MSVLAENPSIYVGSEVWLMLTGSVVVHGVLKSVTDEHFVLDTKAGIGIRPVPRERVLKFTPKVP